MFKPQFFGLQAGSNLTFFVILSFRQVQVVLYLLRVSRRLFMYVLAGTKFGYPAYSCFELTIVFDYGLCEAGFRQNLFWMGGGT